MTELLQSMTDNQLALVGCLGAVGASVLVLAVSYHSRTRPGSQNAEQSGPASAATERREQRRAA